MLTIHHLALRTANLDRLARFYVDVLGLATVRSDAARGSIWLAIGTSVLMLERATDGEVLARAGTRELIAFAVDDRDGWRARLTGAGVSIEAETEHTLYFRDPDGRRLAVSSYPLPEAGS
jgi:catechol 2,3-dioxygenase-like lactoylglutathione lyase family enzyme